MDPAKIAERVGEKKNVESLSGDDLTNVVKEYYEKLLSQESSKYDIEYNVKLRDMQIHQLEMEVTDMRGKFIIPKLKKVHNFKLMGGEE